MPKMMEQELRGLLTSERADALSAMASSKLSAERTTALNYYYGDMQTDMPAAPGRSKAVSTDVADTVEGLMPALMDTFFGGDEVVKFNAAGPEDEAAADQETDYVNHVFTQANPGFLVLYSFIKDALLSKVGIVKVYWEEKQEKERETYLDQPQEVYAALAAAPNVEVIEHTEHPNGSHDVTIEAARHVEHARVVGVPPEEFGISRHARSIAESTYCFHDVQKTQAQLIASGFDEAQVKTLPSHIMSTSPEQIGRDTVDENIIQGDGANTPNRLIRITEHYIMLDYNDDGDVRLYRVTTGSDTGTILKRGGKLDVIEEDRMPFAAMTPVIVTHRFFGRSIADLVKDIQQIKTVLLRSLLDNQYLHNNPRVVVAQSHVVDATLDDLLVSRPGGIVRVASPGGIEWQTVPDITPSIYPAMQYMDTIREWRTGVSRQGQASDPNALQNQVATVANQMFNATQAKVKLIARIFAETGVKDLFLLLHGTIRKHATQPATVRLRNNWVQIDPRDWKTRNDMTVNVGLGTGSKAEQLSHLQLIVGAMKDAVLNGLPIVSARNFYNIARQLTKIAGHPDVEQFFVDPGKPPNQQDPAAAALQKPPDPKQQEAAQKAQIEQAKVQADAAHQEMKTRADIAFQTQKAQIDTGLAQSKAQLEAHLAEQKFALDLRMKEIDAQLKEQEMRHKEAVHNMSMSHMAASHQASMEAAKAKPNGAGKQ